MTIDVVRRATLADVAPAARLAAATNGGAYRAAPAGHRSAPEQALGLLRDLEEGIALYVADRAGRTVAFAQTAGPLIADEGRVVELRSLCLAPGLDPGELGRALVRLVAGGVPVGRCRGIGRSGAATRGVVYGWRP